MSFGKFFSNLIDWSKFSPRILFSLTILCGFFIFGGKGFFATLGLVFIQAEYRPYFGLGFLVFGALFLSFPIAECTKWFYKQLKEIIEQRKKEKNYKDWILLLSKKQIKILRSFIENNTRSMQLDYQDGEVNELINAQFIYLPGNSAFFDRHRVDGMYTDFNLHPWVYKYLKNHSELLDK